MVKAVFLAALLGAFSLTTPAYADDPSIEWHKIETEHFEILFDSKHYSLAKDFARHAETAWLTLAPVLRTWPDKTVVVLDDSSDFANGSATGFPRPTIRLFPATPNPGETIGDMGPWNHELIMHEYTHVLNFQPAHGVFHTLRNLFGAIVRPNLMLPRWYLEGLAVETETRFSPSGGRLRSPDFTAIPRAMVQDGFLRREDISRINEVSIPDWPGGSRPYLLGGLVWNYLSKKDISLVGDLNDHYARRMPFFIEEPLRERLNLDWQSLLDQVYMEIEGRAARQIEIICEWGCQEGERLGESGFFTRSALFSPQGDTLAYLVREHNRDGVLMIADRLRKGEAQFNIADAKRATEATGATRLSWMPDNNALVLDAVDVSGRYEERADLWMYDRERNKKFRLTMGRRAREPDVAPDGKSVVFVQLQPGKTEIAVANFVLDPKSGERRLGPSRVVYRPEGDNRVSWPTFVGPDRIVFVERDAMAKEGLKRISTAVTDSGSRGARALDTGGSATFPRYLAKKNALLFSSNRNGVTNLYLAAMRADGTVDRPKPITNSATRAWLGDLDMNADENLVYSRLDGDGAHLREISKDKRRQNETAAKGELTTIPPLIERTEPAYVAPEPTFKPGELDAHDFSPWPYMLPTYWMPYAAFVPDGAYLSASTSAGDPLGRHLVAASFSTDTRIGKPNTFFAYANSTTPVMITALVDDFSQRLSSSGLDRRTTTGDLSGQFYLPGLSNDWAGELGFSHQRAELPTSAGSIDVRIRGGPRAGILWRDLSQRGKEVSPEKGGLFKLTHARFLPGLGNAVYDQTQLSLAGYFSKTSQPKTLGWLRDRHAVLLSSNVSWAPNLDRLLLGPSSVSLPIETLALGSTSSSFVMRGYSSGSFLARRYIQATMEYRFPLSESYNGFSTSPAFIKRWHAAVFVDGLLLDGAYYDFERKGYRATDMDPIFGSAGIEARLDTTLFYHVPVQFIFGLHAGFDPRVNPGGAYPTISIAL